MIEVDQAVKTWNHAVETGEVGKPVIFNIRYGGVKKFTIEFETADEMACFFKEVVRRL